MKVIKQTETKTSNAFIAVSWFDGSGNPFGVFLEGDTLTNVETKITSAFFHMFEKIFQEYSK